MKAIGGFFAPEGASGVLAPPLHQNAIALSSGRGCFNAVLLELKPKRVQLPFYICGVISGQLRARGIDTVNYPLDADLRPQLGGVESGDVILVANYFGMLRASTSEIAASYGMRCIVDNAHAFFDEPIPLCWSFNSARKFFGVPDGAYLYAPKSLDIDLLPASEPSIERTAVLCGVNRDEAFRVYRACEAELGGEIRAMSTAAKSILAGIDYPAVARVRQRNFGCLHDELGCLNTFRFAPDPAAVPLVYPLLLARAVDHRFLFEQNLFVPTFWPELLNSTEGQYAFERSFAERLIPLPIDHRYDTDDMFEVARRVRRAITASSAR